MAESLPLLVHKWWKLSDLWDTCLLDNTKCGQCTVDNSPNTRGGMEPACEPADFVLTFGDRLRRRRITLQKNGNPTPIQVCLYYEDVLGVACSVDNVETNDEPAVQVLWYEA